LKKLGNVLFDVLIAIGFGLLMKNNT
jgi:hypothetical protein